MTIIHLCALLCVVVSLPSSFASLCDADSAADDLRSVLETLPDYNVREGRFYFAYNVTSHFANPTSIYGGFEFYSPRDDGSHGAYTQYYARPQNAVIWHGCTAPNALYMSIAPYLARKYYDTLPPNVEQGKILLSSLGASLNALVWNTSSTTTSPFNSPFTYVQTPDQQTWNDLNDLLLDNGVDASEINLQSLPDEYLFYLPYEYDATNATEYDDEFSTLAILYRITFPGDESLYLEYVLQNQTVFMIEPKDTTGATAPRIPFEAFTRDTFSSENVNEVDTFQDVLETYKNDLVAFLKEEYNYQFNLEQTFENVYELGDSDYGFTCLDEDKNCQGDNRDAQYWKTPDDITLNERTYYVILGIMHSSIGQATYSNLAIYEKLVGGLYQGVLDGVNWFEYNGSALALPVETDVDDEDLANMFVVQFARPNSFIPDLPGWSLTQEELGSDSDVQIWARNYLNEITKTRPDRDQILPNVLLKFRVRNLPSEDSGDSGSGSDSDSGDDAMAVEQVSHDEQWKKKDAKGTSDNAPVVVVVGVAFVMALILCLCFGCWYAYRKSNGRAKNDHERVADNEDETVVMNS